MHFYRKSATHYLRSIKKMNSASILTRHHWSPSSRMLDIYSSEDEEEAGRDYLRALGKLREDEKPEEEKNQECKICGYKMNPVGVDYCKVCKRSLRISPEDARQGLMDEQAVRQIVMEALSGVVGQEGLKKIGAGAPMP